MSPSVVSSFCATTALPVFAAMGKLDRSSEPFLLVSNTWFTAALIAVGAGYFMYAMEADGVKSARLRNPVPTMGEYVKAECVHASNGKGNDTYDLRTTYAFVAIGFVSYQQGSAAPVQPMKFTTDGWVQYSRMDECEAALPAVLVAKAPRPIWFEKDQPHSARTTLDEPDSRRFLLVSIAGVPLALIGWFLGRRRRPA